MMHLYLLLKQNFRTMMMATVMIMLICAETLAKDAANLTDWPQWRGANRDGISYEKGWSSTWPEGGPKQLWKISVGTGFSSVSVSGGRLYTMGNANKTDTVYCLDANTGNEIWKHSYSCLSEGGGHPGTASTPTIDGKYVFTLSREGHLFCLDSGSGGVIWSKHVQRDLGAKSPDWGYACSPLILGKMLIVNVGITMALDKANGDLIWKTRDYGGGYSSPFVFKLGNLQRLAVFNTLGLVILNPENGQELDNYPWKTAYDVNAATPIVFGDKIFISSGYDVGGALFQISRDKLNVIWRNKNMRNHFNNCVLWEGYLYGPDMDADLRCIDFQTGALKWSQKISRNELMIADGKLIIMTEKGELIIAEPSPDSFKPIARAKVLDGLCWTVPVLSNGRIYCRNHEGDLICLDVKALQTGTMGKIKK